MIFTGDMRSEDEKLAFALDVALGVVSKDNKGDGKEEEQSIAEN